MNVPMMKRSWILRKDKFNNFKIPCRAMDVPKPESNMVSKFRFHWKA